jgi:hypothetical protein
MWCGWRLGEYVENERKGVERGFGNNMILGI